MLTVDIGNTHIKWAVWEGDGIVRSGCSAYSRQAPEVAFDCWAGMQPQKRVIVACVAGDVVELALQQWLRNHWSIDAEFLRTRAEQAGVVNAYADPSQHGVDRWAALLAAHALYRQPACIIDAGTAVTIDLVDADGKHLGGRILPGLAMMRDALLKGTAQIRHADGEVVAFADNTADAVSSGTLHLLQAGLTEIFNSAGQCLGSNMIIIITGGMSELIRSLPGLPAMLHEPDLVLQGLRVAAGKLPPGN